MPHPKISGYRAGGSSNNYYRINIFLFLKDQVVIIGPDWDTGGYAIG
jgi:hypothetical protein